MTDKRLKIASFITQGVYMLACAADIVMCLMYRMCWDTPSGRILADAAMYLTCDLALLPVLPALLDESSALILSGILDVRLNDVLTALKEAGLSVLEIHEKEDWRCIAAKKE
mgnify:CR=1 FL=1